MNALKEELKARNVPGVMLGVDGNNKNAIAFYEKNGFTVITSTPWGKLMGYKVV